MLGDSAHLYMVTLNLPPHLYAQVIEVRPCGPRMIGFCQGEGEEGMGKWRYCGMIIHYHLLLHFSVVHWAALC